MIKPSRSLDMTNGSVADKLLFFAIPLMASSMLQLFFNAADVVVVGQFAGKEALAAVGSNTALINLLVALFAGLSIGTNVVVARYLGSKNDSAVQKSIHCAVLLAILGGILLSAVGSIAAPQFLIWMSCPDDVIELATLYLRIYFLGMPGFMVYTFGAAILRANGDTKRPLYYLTFAGVVNVVLNLFFVVILHLSVAGVALATIIAQYISAVLVLRCLTREEGALRLNLHQLRLNLEVTENIVRIGLPAGFQSILFSLSNLIIQSTVNSFNSDVMSGAAAAASIEAFIYMSMNAFHQTALTFIGQNFGARRPERIDKIVGYCLLYSVITGSILGSLAFSWGESLLSLYIPGETVAIQAGLIRMSYISRFYAICGIMDVMVAVLRGMGKSILPMAFSIVGVCGLRVAWILWIFPLNPIPAMVFISYPITWAITGTGFIIMFLLIRKSVYASLRSA